MSENVIKRIPNKRDALKHLPYFRCPQVFPLVAPCRRRQYVRTGLAKEMVNIKLTRGSLAVRGASLKRHSACHSPGAASLGPVHGP